MCEFSRKGWLAGWTELQCDNLPAMKAAVARMRDELNDPDSAKKIYLFTFNFAKQSNQKTLSLESAIAFWDLLLAGKYTHLDLWKQFLEETHGKSITKDTWALFWDFVETAKDDFSNHDDDGAWPLLIDNFVVYAREKLGLAPAANDDE
nr:DCN1-like protein 1 [Polyrhizophydium stewartii]